MSSLTLFLILSSSKDRYRSHDFRLAVVSEPDDPTAVNAAVTLVALGEYVLQLETDDREKQGVDTLTINVYSDQCTAAQSQPDWEPLVGNINLDCAVAQTGLAILCAPWLNCNTLNPDGD